MKEKFIIVIETLHVDDRGDKDNVSVCLLHLFTGVFACVFHSVTYGGGGSGVGGVVLILAKRHTESWLYEG